MERVPRETRRFLLVSSERLQLLIQPTDVKQFDQMVAGGSNKPLAVLVPFGIHYCAFMRVPAFQNRLLFDITALEVTKGISYSVASDWPDLGSQSLTGC